MGVAYSGGKMRLPGWRHAVVMDLTGLEVPDPPPLLMNHGNRTGACVGMVRARFEAQTLIVFRCNLIQQPLAHTADAQAWGWKPGGGRGAWYHQPRCVLEV